MDRNISESIQQKASEVVYNLSGKDFNFSKKVIDNIFSFVSVTGGAGATTVISNLAYRLAKDGLNVLVIDLNICYPCIHLYFDLEQKEQPDLIKAVNGDNRLGDCLQFKMNKKLSFLVPTNRTVVYKIMVDSKQAGVNFSGIIEQAASLFDVVLIDIPSHGDLTFELANVAMFKSDFIYAVFDENVEAAVAIPRFIKNLQSTGIVEQNLRYVMNKRSSLFYPKRLLREMGIEPEAIIPYEPALIEAALRGNIFLEKGASTSKVAVQVVDAYNKLAEKLLRNGGYGVERSK